MDQPRFKVGDRATLCYGVKGECAAIEQRYFGQEVRVENVRDGYYNIRTRDGTAWGCYFDMLRREDGPW